MKPIRSWAAWVLRLAENILRYFSRAVWDGFHSIALADERAWKGEVRKAQQTSRMYRKVYVVNEVLQW